MIAIVVIVALSIQSCSKTKFYPANLVGTWNVSDSKEVGSSVTIYEDDIASDGELLKQETSTDVTYTTVGKIGTEVQTNTYDLTGLIKSVVTKTTFESGVEYEEVTTNMHDNTSVITRDTTRFNSIYTNKIVFNKDKTFTITTKVDYSVKTEDIDGDSIKEVYDAKSIIVETRKGSWAFIGKDKNQDFKNNERIGLWIDNSDLNTTTTYKYTYTDLNTADLISAPDNTTYESVNLSSDVINTTQPDMVWEMVEGSKKEMKVTFIEDSHETGTTKNTYTIGNTSTITTTESNSKSNTTNIMPMTKE